MPRPSNVVARQRSQVAILTRHRGVDDPDLETARRNLKESLLREKIQAAVASAPPLTPEQLDRLSALLRAG